MPPLIDLHCHILPGVDDGAANLDEAVAMARQAEMDGIEVVCATPHIRHDHEVRIAELPGRAAELGEALAAAGIAVRIMPAGEVAAPILDDLDDAELAAVALGGRWILLEPFPGPLDERLPAAVERLRDRGFRSLVAHPERHPGPGLEAALELAVAAGALVQATAALVAEGPASEALIDLARRGLVHVLGSDSHSARVGRPVRLSRGLARLAEIPELRARLDWIANDAPEAILAGRDVEPVPIEARAD